jgi:hypothetical protein
LSWWSLPVDAWVLGSGSWIKANLWTLLQTAQWFSHSFGNFTYLCQYIYFCYSSTFKLEIVVCMHPIFKSTSTIIPQADYSLNNYCSNRTQIWFISYGPNAALLPI